MPEEYYRQLALLMRDARISSVLAWILVACPIIAVGSWWYNTLLSVVLAFVFIILLIWVYSRNKTRKSKPTDPVQPWTVPLHGPITPLERQNAMEVYPGVYVALTKYGSMRMRVLTQFEDVFDATTNKRRGAANKNANKILGASNHTTIAESTKLLRINIVICEEENKDLIRWVQNTAQTLWRVESIVNFAIVKKENKLLVPNISGQYDISMVNKYKVAVEYVSQHFL